MHQSGQWVETTVYFPMDGGANKAVSAVQAAGSVLTYMRRYALGAALGIVADEDADGNAPPAKTQPAQKPAASTATPARATGNGQQPQAQAATVDAGPPSDAEVAISASNGNFVNMAAALLGTDEMTIKKRMGALRMNAPKTPAERVVAYRRLRDDMGNADDIMQPAAQQPALVTVEQPATDYQE